ncbi:MAG: NusA-like transcription termination signal-binding factor [Candidatus Aenigmarchaeota archaeon]|nr:NusA-like transcription termination signal-binding factor [Candidatus Aenigmarchaeota archaeon]
MSLTFNTETIRLITLFENLTGARVKDCIVDKETNTVYFLIEEGMVGMAIGKNGNVVKNAEKLIGKNIKIFEFSKDLKTFVKKLIPQANEIRIKNENSCVTVEVKVDKKEKPLVIGRDEKNLKILKKLFERNHKVSNLVVR